ncbi:MAG TPA: DUF1918 domain-containing protein [Actinomycetes bacterium]
MQAQVGDKIHVPSRTVGTHERCGRIVEVRGRNGEPPYVVRWDNEDGDRLFIPSGGVVVEPARTS